MWEGLIGLSPLITTFSLLKTYASVLCTLLGRSQYERTVCKDNSYMKYTNYGKSEAVVFSSQTLWNLEYDAWLDGTIVKAPLYSLLKIFPGILSNRGEKFKGNKNCIFIHANAASEVQLVFFRTCWRNSHCLYHCSVDRKGAAFSRAVNLAAFKSFKFNTKNKKILHLLILEP